MTTFFWIMEYIASFIEFFMCCIFCGTFLTEEKPREKIDLMIVWSGIYALFAIILNRINIFSYINSILFILMIVLTQMFIYKMKVWLSFLLTLIYSDCVHWRKYQYSFCSIPFYCFTISRKSSSVTAFTSEWLKSVIFLVTI